MKIGVEYLFKETPVIVRRVRASINYIMGTALMGSSFISSKTGLSPTELSEILGISIVLCNVVLTMFGYDNTDNLNNKI